MPISAHTAPAAATKPVCVPQTNTLPRTVRANIPPPQAPHSKKLSVHRAVRAQGCHVHSMPRAHALSGTSTLEQTFCKVQLDCSPCCCGGAHANPPPSVPCIRSVHPVCAHSLRCEGSTLDEASQATPASLHTEPWRACRSIPVTHAQPGMPRFKEEAQLQA
jgi:hypothetical protein